MDLREARSKLPKIKNKTIIVLDPMLATGNSSVEAINRVKKSGVSINNIFLISMFIKQN